MRQNGRSRDHSDSTTENEMLIIKLIIALEKLEIQRKESMMSTREMKLACRKLIAESKHNIVVIQDREIVFVTLSLARLLGYTPMEMLGTPFAAYVHLRDLFRLAEYYLNRISGGEAPPIYESTFKHRSGKDINVEIRAGIFPYCGKPADLVIVDELTAKGTSNGKTRNSP